jgi:hypothetical protein
MSTRSLIAIENENYNYDVIYCHWDGYPSHVGNMLVSNYNTEDKVKNLVSNGAISSLGQTLKETTFFKDRGEDIVIKENISYDELRDYAKDSWVDYLYVYFIDKECWQYSIVEENFGHMNNIPKLKRETTIS